MSYKDGQNEAYKDIARLSKEASGLGALLEACQSTLEQPLSKEASQEEVSTRLGVEGTVHDFLKTANEYYGAFDVQDEGQALDEIVTIMNKEASVADLVAARNGDPSRQAVTLGKEAALADMVEMYDNGAGLSDCLGAINDRLNQNMSKNASKEENDVFLGEEAACYEVLKLATAADASGQFEDDREAFEAVLKTAADNLPVPRDQTVGGRRTREKAEGKRNWRGVRSGENVPNREKLQENLVEKGIGERARQAAGKAKNWASKNKGKAIGAGAGAAAGAAGLEALRRKYLKNKEQEEGNEKAASQNDEDADQSFEMLQEAGLLE